MLSCEFAFYAVASFSTSRLGHPLQEQDAEKNQGKNASLNLSVVSELEHNTYTTAPNNVATKLNLSEVYLRHVFFRYAPLFDEIYVQECDGDI